MKKAISGLAGVLLAAACATNAGVAWAAGPARAVPERIKGAFPQLALPAGEHTGQQAIAALGERLPTVAAWYGRTPEAFKAELVRDQRMRLDRRGRVFFVEPAHKVGHGDASVPARATVRSMNDGALDGTLAPLDQTFLLHSKPGARRTIYLNFRGATVSGTDWNTGGPAGIVATPYDLDGVPSTNSVAELQRIQYIWQRVAEDYAPFDVDVTTEAVPRNRISRSTSTDDEFGTEALITTKASMTASPTVAANCTSCGGIAYLSVFNETSDTHRLALVFYDQLGNGDEKAVAEAISHEVGHNVGLSHDAVPGADYYAGHGSGATGWAPIMGVGYYQALSQWSKGEYANANNSEDDYVVMQSNGLPLRGDDHGNGTGMASPLLGSVDATGMVAASTQGIIETPGDVDVFYFSAGAGSASFSVKPAVRSPNLDAVLSLRRNRDGALLATSNPAAALTASISVTLSEAGGYSLWVQGTGKGDPKVDGYSNYGSLGQYALTGRFPPSTTQASPSPAALNGVMVVTSRLLLD